MRMQAKMILFAVAYLVGGLVVMVLSVGGQGPILIVPILVWFLVFAVAQFYLFKCPHCGKLAWLKWNGWLATPFVGSSCDKCGRDY